MTLSNKGKCYSKVDRGQRNSKDFYQTPLKMTEALMDLHLFPKNYSVLEPACGDHAIVKVIFDHFSVVQYYDINDSDTSRARDFLEEERIFDCIITNPPFRLANKFIIHAKEVAEHQIAMLLPLNYLQGQERYETIFYNQEGFPLQYVLVFTCMPMLSDTIREDGKYRTGMQSYAWFVWNRYYTGFPQLNWIDSKGHIVNGRDSPEG